MNKLQQLQVVRRASRSQIEREAITMLIDQHISSPYRTMKSTTDRLMIHVAERALEDCFSCWDHGKPSEEDVRLNADDIARALELKVHYDEYSNPTFMTGE